jgi:hypothetical protein
VSSIVTRRLRLQHVARVLQLAHRSRDFRMTSRRRSSVVAGASRCRTERVVGITGTSRARSAGQQDSEDNSAGET